ncbi:hypothetical protein LEP1GSC151_4167 [Leptospira interrogans serovar Grippotyphosa str. LT2186]|uniref:Uncharacterized protein n=1 Tax=Leptospira interrogans serovar Grippotyphosa str. LT2186 TaxID=1001599 RepID=M3I0P9_LEPIR|nr:hypothetical protein LEP1GSC151_4167 [Leptospira interrogans serovar Grippotyphosa str. LT2186]
MSDHGNTKSERKTNRDFRIGLDARMISHSGIGMRIRGLLKYLGPIAKKEKIQIYLFGDLKTIQNEGITCHEFSGFEQDQNPITTKINLFEKQKISPIL